MTYDFNKNKQFNHLAKLFNAYYRVETKILKLDKEYGNIDEALRFITAKYDKMIITNNENISKYNNIVDKYNNCVDVFNLWFIQDAGGHHSNQKLQHTKFRFTKIYKGKRTPNLIKPYQFPRWIDELMEFINFCVDKFEEMPEYLELLDCPVNLC